MMETNTASCGGFPGFSDSFGAALWLIDATLALAVNNYTATLMHVGGQNTFYNARDIFSTEKNRYIDLSFFTI